MIAVVGGGITGLTIGWELRARGVDFGVFEAAERAGGVIRSEVVDDRVLDWGPQRLRLTTEMEHLVQAVGIEAELVRATPELDLFVYREGRLRTVPFSAGAFLRSDVVGWPAKLRMLWEPFTSGPDPRERVSEFFTRKVGKEIYETIIAPLYGGLYGSDPADMEVGLSLIHVLRQFGVRRSLLLPLLRQGGRIAPPVACSFKTGMQALPDGLARALGDRLKLACPIRELRQVGRGWVLQTDEGPIRAEKVILTTPAPVTANFLAQVAPRAASCLHDLRYNPLVVVHLDAETTLDGLGFQVAFTEDLTLRGVTFNHSLFGRKNLYTAYLGGALHPEVAEMSKEHLAELAVREFRECTGFPSHVLRVEHEKMPAWDISWRSLEGFTLPQGLHVAANWLSRPGLPGRLADAKRTAAAVVRGSAPEGYGGVGE